MLKAIALSLFTLLSTQVLSASELKVQKLASNVYALVGELTQRSPTNFGNNSTHGVIVTDEGVILIDSGGTYLGAQQIHETIKTITNQPIAVVINSGVKDNRWFGNSYFKALGARIIATNAANKDQHARAESQMTRLDNLIGDSLKKTEPLPATELYETSRTLTLGGTTLELYHEGAAHTAGDLFVWMPSTQIMFTGDIVFNNRMLGIGPAQDSASRIHVFEKMAAFKPKNSHPKHL